MNLIDRIIAWFFHGFSTSDKGLVFSHGSEPSAWGRIIRSILIVFAILGLLLYINAVAEVTTDVTDTVRERATDGLTQLWYQIQSYVIYIGEILKYVVGISIILFVVATVSGRLSGSQLAAFVIIVIVLGCAFLFAAPITAILWNIETQLRTAMSDVIEIGVRIVMFLTAFLMLIVIAPLFETKRKVHHQEVVVFNTMSFAQGVLFFLVVALGITFIIVVATRISETNNVPAYVTSTEVSHTSSSVNMEQVKKIVSAIQYAQGQLNFDNGENNYLPSDLIRVARKQVKGLNAEGEKYLNYVEKHLYVVQYRQACYGKIPKQLAVDWTRSYDELYAKDTRAMDELTNSLQWIRFKCKN